MLQHEYRRAFSVLWIVLYYNCVKHTGYYITRR